MYFVYFCIFLKTVKPGETCGNEKYLKIFSCDFSVYFNTVYILSHRCVQNKDYPPTSFDAI